MPHMFAPIRWRDLVLDQCVDGFGIRHAQERLGQTHQGHAFIGRKAIFGQKNLHQPGARLPANVAHKLCTAGTDAGAIFGAQIGFFGQARKRISLICISSVVDRAANICIVWHNAPPIRLIDLS